MRVTYDSRSNKVTRSGQRTAAPRIWTIIAEGAGVEKMTFKTKQPIVFGELLPLVVENMMAEGATGEWVRYTAIAR